MGHHYYGHHYYGTPLHPPVTNLLFNICEEIKKKKRHWRKITGFEDVSPPLTTDKHAGESVKPGT
jgi:hypothetical protein